MKFTKPARRSYTSDGDLCINDTDFTKQVKDRLKTLSKANLRRRKRHQRLKLTAGLFFTKAHCLQNSLQTLKMQCFVISF
jgi:hypothetical protein